MFNMIFFVSIMKVQELISSAYILSHVIAYHNDQIFTF